MRILSGDLDFVLVCICSLVEDDMMGELKLLSVSVEIFIWLWSLFVSAMLFSGWYGVIILFSIPTCRVPACTIIVLSNFRT